MITKSRGNGHEITSTKYKTLVPVYRVLFITGFIVTKSIRVPSIKKQLVNSYFRK